MINANESHYKLTYEPGRWSWTFNIFSGNPKFVPVVTTSGWSSGDLPWKDGKDEMYVGVWTGRSWKQVSWLYNAFWGYKLKKEFILKAKAPNARGGTNLGGGGQTNDDDNKHKDDSGFKMVLGLVVFFLLCIACNGNAQQLAVNASGCGCVGIVLNTLLAAGVIGFGIHYLGTKSDNATTAKPLSDCTDITKPTTSIDTPASTPAGVQSGQNNKQQTTTQGREPTKNNWFVWALVGLLALLIVGALVMFAVHTSSKPTSDRRRRRRRDRDVEADDDYSDG